MNGDVRDEISALLEVEPYRLDPRKQVPNSRPRFCWTSLDLTGFPGLTLVQKEGLVEVVVEGEWPLPCQWIEPGWKQNDPLAVYPTFMKAIR